MEETQILKSRYKVQKEAKDLEIYNRFTELMKTPGAQVLQVNSVILQEFPEINSAATIWKIRKRVGARI